MGGGGSFDHPLRASPGESPILLSPIAGPIADGPGVRSTPIPARRDSGTIMFILDRRDSGTIMFILVWWDSNKTMLSRLGGNPAQ